MSRMNICIHVLSFYFFLLSSTLVNAESNNMLNNPFADEYGDYWVAFGDAAIEEIDGNLCFANHNGSYIVQDIELNENPVDNYVLITGLVSTERVYEDGKITGLPYLYGYMIGDEIAEDISGSHIYFHLQSPDMLHSSNNQNEWVAIGDVFKIPEYTEKIRIILGQARQRGVPHNGSVARFDELGVYLFASLNEATAFVDQLY